MAQHEATSTSIARVIGDLAPRFSDAASAISIFAFAIACFDLFATAVGRHSWAATVVAIVDAIEGADVTGMAVPAILIAVLVALLGIAYLGQRASRWADTLKADIRAVVPWGEWLRRRPVLPIVAWLCALPLMASASFALASAVDLFAVAGTAMSYALIAAFTVWSGWAIAATIVGMSRDRFAIIGFLIAALSYVLMVFPFGRSLAQVAPGLQNVTSYSPLVPDPSWIAALLFYAVIGLRAVLALPMERDFEQILLSIGGDEKEPWTLPIHHPNRQFTRPIHLYIDADGAQIMAFARDRDRDRFVYVPLAQLADHRFRADEQQIRLFNLTRISSLAGGKVRTPDPLPVEGSIMLDLRESEFSKGGEQGAERWFTPNEIQSIQEIFDPEKLKHLFSGYLTDMARLKASALNESLRPIEAFVVQFESKFAGAGMEGETRARDAVGSFLFAQNVAGATGAGREAAAELKQALLTVDSHMNTIRSAEKLVEEIPAEIVKDWRPRILAEFERRCGAEADGLGSEVDDFLKALGPGIQVNPCAPPKLLTELKARMQTALTEGAKKLEQIQKRIDEATTAQMGITAEVMTNPNVRGRADLARYLSAAPMPGPASGGELHQAARSKRLAVPSGSGAAPAGASDDTPDAAEEDPELRLSDLGQGDSSATGMDAPEPN
jgi:hypothetical protein